MDDETRRRKRREYMRLWRERNREQSQTYQREYNRRYFADPARREAGRRRAADWYEANRERALAASRDRNARKPKVGRRAGAEHPNWKGEEVGYAALHAWVRRHKGTPRVCELCGITTAKRYEWANVDHRYRRELADWIRLCTSCHRTHDYEAGISKKGGPRR